MSRAFLTSAALAILLPLPSLAAPPILPLPPRPAGAASGSEFVRRITDLDVAARERAIASEILSGNVPQFLRRLQPVTLNETASGRTNTALIHVTPDYLAVGDDQDYFLTPLSPGTAQRIADALNCSLPTRRIVDAIHSAARMRMAPAPIAPSPAMTSVAVFAEHNRMVRSQRETNLERHPLGLLVSGHKKDIVLSPKLKDDSGRVAIYGWHQTNGTPIQPLYLGHKDSWVDYSHGIRLVRQAITVNGEPGTLAEVLTNASLCGLFSDEGRFTIPRYIAHGESGETVLLPGFQARLQFGEQVRTFTLDPEVRVHINAPGNIFIGDGEPLELIFYALPNGNTIEQTVGKVPGPGDDWRFDIQHIGAQTRFLRRRQPDRAIVVAYLEAATKSWPAWRKKYSDEHIPRLIDAVATIFTNVATKCVLTGHSGGGSFTFGFLNVVEQIPDQVERIAFLDSNYAYDREKGHLAKLTRWLEGNERHFLCVLAYDDANALLDGKPFVSASGGTWGRSHAMREDLASRFAFTHEDDPQFQRSRALDGRIQFFLKENPGRKVLHTIQVERNGFIHAMLTGTSLEGEGYRYFGERAYSTLIEP